MKQISDSLRIYLCVVVVGLGLTLFGYVAAQQVLRLGANAPQLQLAEDAGARLAAGSLPADVISGQKVNEAVSLAPFITIVDADGNVLASSGKVGDISPVPPSGVFTHAAHHTNQVTWEHDGVRDAAIVVHYGGAHPGFVIAARSLRQVEHNIDQLGLLALLTALGVIIAPAIILALTKK